VCLFAGLSLSWQELLRRRGDMQKPSIGRIVHYRNAAGIGPLAAIITCVYSDACVNLTVFRDGALMDTDTSIPLRDADNGEWGCWWPPRV